MHLTNLFSPSEDSSVRELDADHVTNICTQIKRSHSYYTTLIGVVKTKNESEINISDLQNPNTARIEVIGGNHTREAYKRLREEGYLEEQFCLPVDLYTNLSIPQILNLGFMHNEIHEHSKKMTFEEKIKLFRKIRLETNMEHPNASPRVWSSLWRGRLATLTNRSVSTFVWLLLLS